MASANLLQVRQVAREKLGITELRAEQEAAILAVLAQRDTLVVMPTGAGKSAIYQAAALLIPGPTVVVSPLIALQRDQLESLRHRDVAPAAALNSAVPAEERREALAELDRGALEFLFLAPEQLQKEEVLEHLRASRPSLFVIDEAHCVSEWGHDFRPDYLRLGAVIAALGHPTVLALTATAAPAVRQEITARLGMSEPKVIVSGFDRPNIHLGAQVFESDADKRKTLLSQVQQADKPGIVYTATRRHAEEIADALSAGELRAVVYHAGLNTREREAAHSMFMNDEADVIVATSAFGMGIDKRNVRFVFHYGTAGSLDAYYQEIGRAGRDGLPSRAVLFYRPADLALHKFFAGGAQLSLEQVERVAQVVRDQAGPTELKTLAAATELSSGKLDKVLSRLTDLGVVEIRADGLVVARSSAHDLHAAAAGAVDLEQSQHDHDLDRIDQMRAYAEAFGCRREYLLAHFEEPFTACSGCDNCDAGRTAELLALQQVRRAAPRLVADITPTPTPFPAGCRVRHKEWGAGQVLRHAGNKMTVRFDHGGDKLLDNGTVVEHRLLFLEDLVVPRDEALPAGQSEWEAAQAV